MNPEPHREAGKERPTGRGHLVGCLVLAGGEGKRLGVPKAWAEVQGEPLLVRAVRNLSSLGPPVVVAAAPGQELPPVAAPVIRDEVERGGPLAGIASGLGWFERKAGEGRVFVVACDFPFLRAEAAEELAAIAPEAPAVLPAPGGIPQPLLAVYSSSLSPLALELARLSSPALELGLRCGAMVLSADESARLDPDGLLFFNVNTPADLDRARSLAAGLRAAGRAGTEEDPGTPSEPGVWLFPPERRG